MWHRTVRKTLYTLNVDNYCPAITELTYPFLQIYADKIGAAFHVIDERKYPDMPPVYEKVQIYELSREHDNDWNIYIDSDALIHPDLYDITDFLDKDTALHYSKDLASIRWHYDHYFWRDGRNIGSGNWFTIASDWCRDLWHPLEDMTFEEAVKRIKPIVNEAAHHIEPGHLIDDFVLSRNIARYGLKFITYLELQDKLGHGGNYHWHQYTRTQEEKIQQIKQVIRDWGLLPYLDKALAEKILSETTEPKTAQNGQLLEGNVPLRLVLQQ